MGGGCSLSHSHTAVQPSFPSWVFSLIHVIILCVLFANESSVPGLQSSIRDGKCNLPVCAGENGNIVGEQPVSL